MKVCAKHGVLTKDDLIKKGKTKAGTPQYRCRMCMKDLHDKYYEINRDIILNKQNQYRIDNPDKRTEAKYKSWKKHADKNRDKDNERRKRFDKKQTETLADRYMKKLIVKGTTLSWTDIPQSMIELKRSLLLLKKGMADTLQIKLGDKLNEDK